MADEATLNPNVQPEESASTLRGANPPSNAEKQAERRKLPEAEFGSYLLVFPPKREPALILPSKAGDPDSARTIDSYRIFPKVELRCKVYIAQAFGFNQIPAEDADKLLPLTDYQRVAEGQPLDATLTGGTQDYIVKVESSGKSFGIIFKGEISQPTVDGEIGNTPIRGGVVRVRVPSIVTAKSFIAAMTNAANTSTAGRSAISGIVTPSGRKLRWGEQPRKKQKAG